jgi:protein O-GlcNAc transferase
MMRKLLVCLASLCLYCSLGVPAVCGQAKPPGKPGGTDRLTHLLMQGAPLTTVPNAQTIAEARALLEAGKIDAAIEALTNAAKSKPVSPQIDYLLGLAYHRKRDYLRAVEHLSAVIQSLPENGLEYRQAIQILGLSHYLLGHYREAIPYLEQISQSIPDSLETSYALGTCYIQTRNPEKSRVVFARMFKLSQSAAAAYVINAQMMIRQQFEELAEQELKRALELDAKLPQANFLLGEMAIFHAEIDRGIALLQKEIEINPAFALAYYWLGEGYTRQLKWDEAIAPLQKSIWLNPYFSGNYIVLGKVYLKKGDLENAESFLRRATQMDPNNFSAHHLLAQVLQRGKKPEEARREFETAEKLRTTAVREP